ncbi:MAG: hypothetical protein GY765_32985, partial [bacterium]|nr:hypothetical protein [bacterium]
FSLQAKDKSPTDINQFEVKPDGNVTAGGQKFDTLTDYFRSDYFKSNKKRCGSKHFHSKQADASTGDCTTSRTVIQAEYYSAVNLTIPIVFHIIHRTDGTGNISDQRINDQVQVLNEDFGALSGSPGADGYDTKIRFELAGITRTANNTWYGDTGELTYKGALGWDQSRYLNVYLNTAGGILGYAYFPQDYAGDVRDGVVLFNLCCGGRDIPGLAPYDQGRTLVHEIGHYLGLGHTFAGNGCYDGYNAGDWIADTNSENTAHHGCTQTYTCSSADPIHNYMNYTDDTCMYLFTPEQANRMVCGLVNYRPNLYGTSTTPKLTITAPNGGESLGTNLTHQVRWTSTGLVNNVTILLYKGNAFVYAIGTVAVSAGSCFWNIPLNFAYGTDYKVRVYQGPTEDYSDAEFSIGRRNYYVFHGKDFTGDGIDNMAIYRPANGRWCVRGQDSVAWGNAGDIPVAGDYDGDGSTDLAVYRPSTGRWCIKGQASIAWGTAADIPVPGDYDGNGTTDIAIYRPSTGRWCIRGQASIAWGTATDIPVPGDYNGNGSTDIAIYRPSNGRWCVRGQASIAWGTATDIPVPGDYDGNGTMDIGIYRPSNGRWCVKGQPSIAWGTADDIPVPADYDGNGTDDIAIFRPANGAWSVKGGTSVLFGTTADIPLVSHWNNLPTSGQVAKSKK